MGFFSKLFGAGAHKDADEQFDDEDNYYPEEELSESDAEDIWRSSGMDEDYDFRSSIEEDEDADDDGDDHSNDSWYVFSYEVSPQELLHQYQLAHPPRVTGTPQVPSEIVDHELYNIVCWHCDGYGVIGIGTSDDDGDYLAAVTDCWDCHGEGFLELHGDEAIEALEHGHMLVDS